MVQISSSYDKWFWANSFFSFLEFWATPPPLDAWSDQKTIGTIRTLVQKNYPQPIFQSSPMNIPLIQSMKVFL